MVEAILGSKGVAGSEEGLLWWRSGVDRLCQIESLVFKERGESESAFG